MNRSNERTTIVRAFLKHCARFTSLWCLLFVIVLLAALVEGFVLWRAGVRYEPQTSVQHVSVVDFSVSANGDVGLSRIRVKRRLVAEAGIDAVVVHDLQAQTSRRLDIGELRPQRVTLSPIGNAGVVACENKSLYAFQIGVAHALGNQGLRLFSRVTDGRLRRVAFSPDGHILSAVGERSFYLWKWPNGELLMKRPHAGGPKSFVSFSGDSRRMLTPGNAVELCVWDTTTCEPIRTIRTDAKELTSAILSPDGRLCACVTDKDLMHVYDVATGKELWRAPSLLPSMAFSPDGRFLAMVASRTENDLRISISDSYDGVQLFQLPEHHGVINGISFAAKGILYMWDIDGDISAWDISQKRERWCLSMLEWASEAESFAQVPGKRSSS